MSINAEDVQQTENLDDFINLFEGRESHGYDALHIIAEALLALAKANKKEFDALKAKIEDKQ
jgi:hypothetical protein